MEPERFEAMYRGQAPWDIPAPQPEVVRREEAGEFGRSVLDAGCGTGENALYLASRGHEVWGIDFLPVAIERARAKALQRALDVDFRVADALDLGALGRTFDGVLDCGLFHTFSDEERPRYVAGLARVVRPGGRVIVLCFSDKEPGTEGPRRVTQQEIRHAFRDGWEVESIRDTAFTTVESPDGPRFSPGGPQAWVATIRRQAG
jgi:ubiquinone/menaquinone biosynthesis C-methylase UbiE